MGPFRVALSGDFRKADGSPTFPDFDLTPLAQAKDVEMVFLDNASPIRGDQLEDFDALILLAHRFDATSVPKSGRLAVVARFGVGYTVRVWLEGVLAASALKCVGGHFQGRLIFRNDDERARAARTGVTDLDRKYDLHELVSRDAIFAATGVTKGAMLDGVKVAGGFVSTHTLVMDSSTRTVQRIRTIRPL